MAFEIRDTLIAIYDIIASGGYVEDVVIGEPNSPPTGSMASIFMREVWVGPLSLGTTTEEHLVFVRIYIPWLNQDREQAEQELASVVSNIMADFAASYTLSSTVRNIDFGGQRRQPMRARWGFNDLGGTIYRTSDIEVGLIVDDSATFSP